MPQLILASTSTIRQTILRNAGLKFAIRAPQLDEAKIKQELTTQSARDTALTLASQKALSLPKCPDLIIGADQTLSCQGVHYNKPTTTAEAHQQLIALRGQTHTLHSALAIAQHGKIIWSTCDEAKLTMRHFSDKYAKTYTEACGSELFETVGSYKLEGLGAQLFDKIEGDYFTILGLPLLPCLAFLRHIKFMTS